MAMVMVRRCDRCGREMTQEEYNKRHGVCHDCRVEEELEDMIDEDAYELGIL